MSPNALQLELTNRCVHPASGLGLPTDAFIAISGTMADVDNGSQSFAMQTLSLGMNVSTNTSYYNDFSELSSEEFWGRAANERPLFIEGNLTTNAVDIRSVYLPANEDEYEDYIVLDGTVSAFDSDAQTLSLEGYEDFNIHATSDSRYFSEAAGEIDGEGFWSALAQGSYVVVEGELSEGKLLARQLVLMNGEWDNGYVYLTGSVESFDDAAITLQTDDQSEKNRVVFSDETLYFSEHHGDLSKEEFLARLEPGSELAIEAREIDGVYHAEYIVLLDFSNYSYIEAVVASVDADAKSFRISGADLVVQADKDTLYGDYCGVLEADVFWQHLKSKDRVFVGGVIEGNSLIAEGIYFDKALSECEDVCILPADDTEPMPGDTSYVEGELLGLDPENSVIVVSKDHPCAEEAAKNFSIALQTEGSVQALLESAHIRLTVETLISQYDEEITLEEFWQYAKTGDWIAAEGLMLEDESLDAQTLMLYTRVSE